MANRPSRSSKSATKKPKKSQVEINRIKPVGVLSLQTLTEKSSNVATINVKLPDGEVYEFYHTPITANMLENLSASSQTGVRDLLADVLTNRDGSPFVEDAVALGDVSMDILNLILKAINDSDREEPGED